MPCSWEDNHRSGAALASGLASHIHQRAHGLRKGDEHPAYTPRAVGYGTLLGCDAAKTSLCSASYVAENMTLLAFADDRRAAVDMDRKTTAPVADAPCSNRSTSPARGNHSSKPAAHRSCGARRDRQTDRHRIVT